MVQKLILWLAAAVIAAVSLSSCGEYQRVLKSNDANYKFEYAKRAFEQKKYVQSYTLLKDVVTVFKGSDKAEESLYLLAMSHYENKEYPDAASYSRRITSVSPKGSMPSPRVITPDTHITSIHPKPSSTSRRQSRPSRSFRDFLTSSPAPTRSRSHRTPSSSCKTN